MDRRRMAGLFIALVLLVGCGQSTTYEKTIETEDGKATITATTNAAEDEWCSEGANWQYSGDTPDGAANAEWKIEKLMTEGKYEGLCHVVYTAQDPSGKDIKMDYYFSEDGESGYMEWDINGQKMSNEWHK